MSGDTIVLWLPKPPDNANTTLHHMVAAKRKRAYLRELDTRAQARLGFPAPPATPLRRVTIGVEWHYPNRRHLLDDDNAIRRLKPVADYLVRHGYLAGDTSAHVTWEKPTICIGATSRPPLSTVRLTLTPTEP